jgi:hypothetical protein
MQNRFGFHLDRTAFKNTSYKSIYTFLSLSQILAKELCKWIYLTYLSDRDVDCNKFYIVSTDIHSSIS